MNAADPTSQPQNDEGRGVACPRPQQTAQEFAGRQSRSPQNAFGVSDARENGNPGVAAQRGDPGLLKVTTTR